MTRPIDAFGLHDANGGSHDANGANGANGADSAADSSAGAAGEPARADLLARIEAEASLREFPSGSAAALLGAVEAVLAESERVNLTGAKTLAVAVEILVLDAMPVGSAWPADRPPPRVAVDLGTGNGFPGVAVALRWPACKVVLVERREKKAKAVERALAAAGISSTNVVACDGRELLRQRPALKGAVDLVVVRAVGDLAPATKEAAPWLARGGRIVHWKSANLDDAERRAGVAAARSVGLVPLPDLAFRASASHPARLLVSYERPL